MLASNPENVVEKLPAAPRILSIIQIAPASQSPVFLVPSMLLPADFVATVLRGHWSFAVDARRRRKEVEEALKSLLSLELEALDAVIEVWRSLEGVYRGVARVCRAIHFRSDTISRSLQARGLRITLRETPRSADQQGDR